MTPAEIEPATFRFVAQHLNHCANTVHIKVDYSYKSSGFKVPEVFFCFAKCPAQAAFCSTCKFGTERRRTEYVLWG